MVRNTRPEEKGKSVTLGTPLTDRTIKRNANKTVRNQLDVVKVSVALRLRDLWSDVLGVSGHLMD